MSVLITPLTEPAVRSGTSHRLAWLAAAPEGWPLGSAFLRLPAVGQTAELDLVVHPAERRAGVGTRLLDAVTAAAGERGLRGVLTGAVDAGSAGERFCVARGLRRVLALTYTRLALEGAPPQADAVPGYRLVHWEGTVPDDLAETFARSRRAMDDMPMDEAGYLPEPWDVERLHRIADAVAQRGDVLSTVAAVAADGEIAAFTELVVPRAGVGDGLHYGTGVLPEHRGRGLARWMKADAIGRVRHRHPGLAGLVADTADSNVAMRRVNESLGYRATHRSLLYRLDLPV